MAGKRKLLLQVETCRGIAEFEETINKHLSNLARIPYQVGADADGWWGVVYYYEWVEVEAEAEAS